MLEERHGRNLPRGRSASDGASDQDQQFLRRELPDDASELLRVAEQLDSLAPCADVAPRRFGDFELLREIGRGGMGVVYEAYQTSMKRRVALKVLPATLASDEKARARFEREARTAGQLEHEVIVRAYGLGVEADIPYFTMEYVEGETLHTLLERLRSARPGPERSAVQIELARRLAGPAADGRPAPGSSAAIDPSRPPQAAAASNEFARSLATAFAEVCDALTYAHTQGVIHRDIKPRNLILDARGRLRILDFGLASLEEDEGLTRTGHAVGTLSYMSPEQARGESGLDQRADIYSIGATLYEMLALQPPFHGRDRAETLQQLELDEPPALRGAHGVPTDLETIVLKCLRKDPGSRYGTAGSLGQDLRSFVRGDPIEARPESQAEKWLRTLRRHRARLAVAFVLVSLLVVAGWLYRRETVTRQQRDAMRYDDVVTEAARELNHGQFTYGGRELGNMGLFIGARFNQVGVPETGAALQRALAAVAAAVEDRPEAHYYLGRLLLVRGEVEAGRRELQRALDIHSRFVPAAFFDLLERQPDRASQDILADLIGEHEDVSSWQNGWLRARRAMMLRDWGEAEKANSIVLRHARNDSQALFLGAVVEAHMGRGVARLRQERWIAAIGDFEAARALWPNYPEATLILAKTHFRMGHREDGQRVLEELYEVLAPAERSRFATCVCLLAGSLNDRGLRSRWKPRMDRLDSLRLAGFAGFFTGRVREGIQISEEIRRDEPDDLVAGAMGGFCRLIEEWERDGLRARAAKAQLLRDAARLVDVYPTDFHALGLLAQAYLANDRVEDASRVAARLVATQRRMGVQELMSNHIRAWVRLAQGRLDEAEQHARTLIAYAPDNFLRWMALGNVLERKGDLDGALEVFEEASRRHPGWAGAHSKIAHVLLARNDLNGAIERASRVVTLRPRNTRAFDAWAEALVLAGRPAEALKVIDEGIRRIPDRSRSHEIRSRIVEQLERSAASLAVK